MEVIRNLKGGSFSNTKVIFDGNKKIVRKSINHKTNREYGLVRWQSQVRKLQLLNQYIPESTVTIERVGVSNDYYFYDIPYYERHFNCFEALLNGESEDLIAEKVSVLLSKMAAIKYKSCCGGLALYVSEEMRTPLELALKAAEQNCLSLTNLELNHFMGAVSGAIIKIEKLLEELKDVDVQESLTHGNLTLENMLWDSKSKEIIMIDPYAETYCETIMGDVSQLFQSSASGYEYISGLYDQRSICIEKYPVHEIPSCLVNFSKKLTDRISNEDWYLDKYLSILRASQFIRMFPFKISRSPRQGVLFILHGIKLFEEN